MSEDFIGHPLDPLLGYEPGMPMPRVRAPDDRQWHPEDAKAAPGPGQTFAHALAARTASEDAWVLWSRKHKLAHRWKVLTARCTRQAADDARLLAARQIVRRLLEQGRLDMTEVVDSEAARAEEALAFVVSVVKNAAENTKDRLAAAKTLLEWSKAKPASKSDVTVKSALDWLDEVGE